MRAWETAINLVFNILFLCEIKGARICSNALRYIITCHRYKFSFHFLLFKKKKKMTVDINGG